MAVLLNKADLLSEEQVAELAAWYAGDGLRQKETGRSPGAAGMCVQGGTGACI